MKRVTVCAQIDMVNKKIYFYTHGSIICILCYIHNKMNVKTYFLIWITDLSVVNKIN